MNNIFLPNDPLLYNSPSTQMLQQEFQQKMEQKYNDYLMRNMQNIPDRLSELDSKMKSLDSQVLEKLNEDIEFNELNQTLQATIQAELMMLIKQKLNTNQEALKNIERQLVIIKNVESKINEDERKNISELNDYLKNYSNMTFDEYKKLKNMKNEDTGV
jgi:hypothetical protein